MLLLYDRLGGIITRMMIFTKFYGQRSSQLMMRLAQILLYVFRVSTLRVDMF